MEKEMRSLEEARTFELTERPPGAKVVGSKWVYKVKRNLDGIVDKYKARLWPRVLPSSLGGTARRTHRSSRTRASERVLLALSAAWNLELHSINVTAAFLHGKMEEEVYIAQPKGFEVPDREDDVARLTGNLCGLKQAGRTWSIPGKIIRCKPLPFIPNSKIRRYRLKSPRKI